MSDKDFYESTEKLLEQVIRQCGKLALDIGLLNEVMMELHRRQKNLQEA